MEDEEAEAVLRAVGRQIKAWREAAGLKQGELGARIGYSEEMVSSVERGRRLPKPDFLDRADEVLSAHGKLAVMKEDVEKARYPKNVRDLAKLEDEAIEMGAYVSSHIHGLLQTAEYAQAVYTLRRPAYTEDEVERLVAARMARKSVFDRVPRPLITFVQEEVTLRRPVGGREILRRQLQHLLDIGRLPHVEIQVMPTDRQDHAGLSGPIRLLKLRNGKTLGHLEVQLHSRVISEPSGSTDPRYALWNDPSTGSPAPGVDGVHRESAGRRSMTTSRLTWFKSSYSSADGPDCVEVAITPATIHIRDSKNTSGAQLAVTGAAWTAFLDFAAHCA